MNRIEKARADWHARFNARDTRLPKAQGKLEVKAAGDVTELMLYDEIGFWGVTAKQFNEALAGITTPKVLLRINSPGGDVFDGYAMFNALKAHKSQIAVVVDGLAASAASFVALAGDTLTMADPAMLMIHRAWTLAIGNVNDLKQTADLLAKVDQQIADVYAGATGKPAADMLALMDAETWLTAQEAADLGFVDEITQADDPKLAGVHAAAAAARLRAARLVQIGR